MSKEYTIIILYLLGWFTLALWMIGSKELMDDLKKRVDTDPELSIIPEKFIRIVSFIVMLLVCIPWPWFIIKYTVRGIYKNIFKKGPKENK